MQDDRETREAFAVKMMELLSTFQQEADTATINGYFMALEDLPMISIASAIRRAMREYDGYAKIPRPAELRRLAGDGGSEDAMLEAWAGVVKQIQSVGSHGKPEFSAPVREAVVACGGWKRLCGCTANDLHNWVKKAFLENLSSELNRKEAEASKKLYGKQEQKRLGE